MRDAVVVVRRRPEAMAYPPRREVVREVVRRPIVEERRMGPPRGYLMEDQPPMRRYVEPPPPVRRVVAPPRREFRGEINGGEHREQWEIDLLKPQPGITVESVREVQPGDPKYEQYLYGQGYQRMEAGYRRGPPEMVERPIPRVREREPVYNGVREREPVYNDRPVERVVRERRPVGEGWRDNFRGQEYYDDDY